MLPLLLWLTAASSAQDAPAAEVPAAEASTPPVRWRDQPIDPKGNEEGTAHTLGKGKVSLGLVRQAWGPLDNVELSTVAAADLIGFPNVGVKVTAIQTPAVDIAGRVGATWLNLPMVTAADELKGSLVPVGWTGTWTTTEHLSLSLGGTWNILSLRGTFTTAQMAEGLATATGTEIDPALLDVLKDVDEDSDVFAATQVVLSQGHLGLDWRLNRRDTLLLRTTSFTRLSGTVQGGYSVTEGESGTTAEIGPSARLVVPLQDQISLLATLSWEWQWRRLHLRVGVPLPIGSSWVFALPEAFSLHWVLGGGKAASPGEKTGT